MLCFLLFPAFVITKIGLSRWAMEGEVRKLSYEKSIPTQNDAEQGMT
jgi:hypothetical protein